MTVADLSIEVTTARGRMHSAFATFEDALSQRREKDAALRSAVDAHEAAVVAAKREAHACVESDSPTKHRIISREGEWRTVSTAERDLFLIEFVAGHPQVATTRVVLRTAEAEATVARDYASAAEKRLSVARTDLNAIGWQLQAATSAVTA